jgi:hypothetical protein
VLAYRESVPGAVSLNRTVLDGNVEILWVPDKFVYVLYHFYSDHAIPIPLASGVTRNPAIRGHLGSGQRNLAQKQRLAPPRLGADLTTYSFPIARVFHGVTDPRGTSSAAA